MPGLHELRAFSPCRTLLAEAVGALGWVGSLRGGLGALSMSGRILSFLCSEPGASFDLEDFLRSVRDCLVHYQNVLRNIEVENEDEAADARAAEAELNRIERGLLAFPEWLQEASAEISNLSGFLAPSESSDLSGG